MTSRDRRRIEENAKLKSQIEKLKKEFDELLLKTDREKADLYDKITDIRKQVRDTRNTLYEQLPTGDIDAFALINIVKKHIDVLDEIPNGGEMKDAIVLRPELRKFAEAMEMELSRHDTKKGKSWKKLSLYTLEQRIKRATDTIEYQGQDIDVASICMMHFDNEFKDGSEVPKVEEGKHCFVSHGVKERPKPKTITELKEELKDRQSIIRRNRRIITERKHD